MTTPSPELYREIPLGKSADIFALVDEADYDWLMRWKWYPMTSPTAKGYYAIRQIWNGGKKGRFYMHREIMGLPRGGKPDVDHINGNPLDNRRSNLRIATRSQNQANRRKNTNNTSGFKGVTGRGNQYAAQITVDGRRIYLGCRPTAQEAHELYKEAARKFHGEFARFE